MNRYQVNRCVCHEISFREILEYAKIHGLTTAKELQRAHICSTQCKLCLPYVKMVLETEETAFEPGAYLKKEETG